MKPHLQTGLCLLLAIAGMTVARAADAPRVTVAFNDSISQDVFRGMPLLVTISLMHPTPFNPHAVPVVLEAQSKPWTNWVRLLVRNAGGQPIAWPWHAAIRPGIGITLDATRYGRYDLWLTPTETAAIPAGSYTIEANLDTTLDAAANSWKGLASAPPAAMTVRDQPTPLTQHDAEYLYGQRALFELFDHHGETALQTIGKLLVAYPRNIPGKRIQAHILHALGRPQEALTVVQDALDIVYSGNAPPPEPPLNLLQLESEIATGTASIQVQALQIANLILVRWTGEPGAAYSVETSTDLKSWAPAPGPIISADDQYSVKFEATSGRRFFRVVR